VTRDAVAFIDVGSLLHRMYGKKKQGVGFGYAKVGGYQVLLRERASSWTRSVNPGQGVSWRSWTIAMMYRTRLMGAALRSPGVTHR
jgi:hypothetical protein